MKMKIMNNQTHQVFNNIFEGYNIDHLHQGDIFPSNLISIIFENEEDEHINEEEDLVGWILLNPDCDVYEKKRINFLALAPVYNLQYYTENFSQNKREIKDLIKQKKKEFYFLYPDSEISANGSFVQIGNVESILALMPINDPELGEIQAYDFLLNHRIKSLKHKWKAEFAHKLGNYFNRMGTPDIDETDLETWIERFKESLGL